MALKLMYITNDKEVAKIAENSGVDWIFVDLEINGKDARQGHLDTVISRHTLQDVKSIKSVLSTAKLMVRVNPIYDGSKKEIDAVIENGADIVMLPYFTNKLEVETFIKYVDGRSEVCLLVETPGAVENIDSILLIDGIDHIHIGLNDLHLGYKKKFMFELLADGTVEMLCKKFESKGIEYGFGGIAKLKQGTLPAEKIIAEHYRLKSQMAILSRSFCNTKAMINTSNINELFIKGISDIRSYEAELLKKDESFYIRNQNDVKQIVGDIIN